MFDHGDAPRPVPPKRTCSFFLQGCCHKGDDPAHLEQYAHEKPGGPPAFAFDCEFVQVCDVDAAGQPVGGNRQDASYRWPVSIGLVDQRMETLLYSRIRKPARSIVTDDRFSRTSSAIQSEWGLGLPRRDVAAMVAMLVKAGGPETCLVGWDVANDIAALGFEDAAAQVRRGERHVELRPEPLEDQPFSESATGLFQNVPCHVVELQDYFRSANGDRLVRLEEAFKELFQRSADAHDSVEDAKMTMELYLDRKSVV